MPNAHPTSQRLDLTATPLITASQTPLTPHSTPSLNKYDMYTCRKLALGGTNSLPTDKSYYR